MRFTRLGRGRIGVLLVLMLLASLLSPKIAAAAPAQNNRGNTDWVQVYTVQRGDTLSEIALSFGVSEEALLRANSLRNANFIFVGQQLIIPEKSSHGTGGPQCADYHTVRRGDTLSEIALYNGVDEYVLARANGIYDLNDIYVGQRLCIPAKGGGYNQPPKQDYPKYDKPKYEEPKYEAPKYEAPKQEAPKYDGPKNDGPKYDGPRQDGPQRPAEQGQRPDSDGPHQDGPGCSGPCGGPVRPADEPWKDGGHKPDAPRPTEYWKGTYYNDKYFSEFALERQDLEINFNWMTGSPFGELDKDRFSVRWEKVEYFKAGSYRFYAIADDGVRVYVDDQLIIDGWVIQPATEYKADVNLGEGPHKLVVEYYEEAEDAQIRVYWEPRHHKK
jgi:LysM repeat protein